MCKRNKDNANSTSLVYMNTPINSPEEDVIGFSTHVDKLDAAIKMGAQMIALTSPFGAGKTSIIELLQSRYAHDRNTKVLKISMWSHLCKGMTSQDETGDTTELHRGLIYQLISQISRTKGIYVSKRLNPSYGLLKLHTNKLRYWVYLIFALIFFVLGYILPEQFGVSLSLFGEKSDVVESILLLLSFVICIIIFTRSEIVFSSNKSEGERKIDSNEIMQLYRSEVLQHKNCIIPKRYNYVVVIEDLDRTDDGIAVINFLKELRKYYIPSSSTNSKKAFTNRVSFLINVKPEAQLCEQIKGNDEYGHLYAKLFDYVLNLQTINIDDYETILEGLLQQKEDEIKAIGIKWSGSLLNIPGIRWIIRGSRLGIREIKDRLNTAFASYESLTRKFGDTVAFEKCAAVAYIMSEFEEDFYRTDDRAFQGIVNDFLKNNLDEAKCSAVLPNTSEEYTAAIHELVNSKLIDSNYRMYFYNYPQNSRVFTVDESIVHKAILYAEQTESLPSAVKTVIDSNSTIVREAFQTRKQLGLLLPDLVFNDEALYIEALKTAFSDVLLWVEKLDYSPDACDKTIGQICSILHFDANRHIFTQAHAASYRKIWESKFSETSLLQLRKALCAEFPNEILWYSELFFGVHNEISLEELNLLSLTNALQLINTDTEDLSNDLVNLVIDRFSMEDYDKGLYHQIENFFRSISGTIDTSTQLRAFLSYMRKTCSIVSDFEQFLFAEIQKRSGNDREALLQEYQKVINLSAEKGLSNQTLNNICRMDYYKGYSDSVTAQLECFGHYLDSTLQLLTQNKRIPFEKEEVAVALEKEIDWLVSRQTYFAPLRRQMIEHDHMVLDRYHFMFTSKCPVMEQSELSVLHTRGVGVLEILVLIPPVLVTDEVSEWLQEYFCKNKHGTKESFEILLFISRIDSVVARSLFYALDFDMVRYRYMSSERRNHVKVAFNEILSLDTPEGRLEFMGATKHLESVWETEILSELKEDKEQQRKYIDVVNSVSPITKNTINTLCALGSLYPMKEEVQNKLFEAKKYTEYVVCKTLKLQKFEIETGDNEKLLWPIYLEIFGKSNFSRTRAYMAANQEFLAKIMKDESFVGMNDEAVMCLAAMPQTSSCILDVFNRGYTFALEYFTKINGFVDKAAATSFVEFIETSQDLLKSDELYEHVHEKLVNGVLKGKYTRARTKHGYAKPD